MNQSRVSFKILFCEQFQCSPEEYEMRVLWRCLYPQCWLLAKFVYWANPGYFKPDFQTIQMIANAVTVEEAMTEVNSIRIEYHKRSKILRNYLKVRLSGKRLLRLAASVLRDVQRPVDQAV